MNNIQIALEIMGKGMVGIFAALVIIALSVWVMQKIFKNKGEE